MRTLQDIQYSLGRHKQRLFHEYPIKAMAIFGSYARSAQRANSDVDILVEFSDKIGIRFVDLAEDLEAIIGCKVDLVSKKGVKKKYFQSITSDLIYV